MSSADSTTIKLEYPEPEPIVELPPSPLIDRKPNFSDILVWPAEYFEQEPFIDVVSVDRPSPDPVVAERPQQVVSLPASSPPRGLPSLRPMSHRSPAICPYGLRPWVSLRSPPGGKPPRPSPLRRSLEQDIIRRLLDSLRNDLGLDLTDEDLLNYARDCL